MKFADTVHPLLSQLRLSERPIAVTENFQICLAWPRYQDEDTSARNAMLLYLHELTAEKRAGNLKQPTIHAFSNSFFESYSNFVNQT